MTGKIYRFDSAAAAAARDAAMQEAEDNAKAEWKAGVLFIIEGVAKVTEEFTTDRIWWFIDKRGVGRPREPRALGPMMRKAAANGWIAKTDRTRKGVRPECHRRDLRVWKSLVYHPDNR